MGLKNLQTETLLEKIKQLPPPKISEVENLIAELERNGITNRGGKGGHRNYLHRLGSKSVTISGKVGKDALRYQIKEVRYAIIEMKSMRL